LRDSTNHEAGETAGMAHDDAADVRSFFGAQREAMLRGDADALGGLLAETFTLTHMTGYVQSKAAWLADVASGAMRYHDMRDVELTVGRGDDTAIVTARTVTEATIWGAHGTWRLQLRTLLERTDVGRTEGWTAAHTVASTW